MEKKGNEKEIVTVKQKIVSDKKTFRKAAIVLVFITIAILAFIVAKPYLLAIIGAVILAYILYPLQSWLSKKIKTKGWSAFIISIVFVGLIILIIALFFQLAVEEAFNFYQSFSTFDINGIVDQVVSLVLKPGSDAARQISLAIQQTVSKLVSGFMETAAEFMTNLPKLILEAFITFFVMFFILKDAEKLKETIKGVLPFKKSINEHFFSRSKKMIRSLIFGVILVGLIQGIVCGLGFFIFGAPNPILLTIPAIILSIILPVVGPALVWLPISLLMIVQGNVLMGILLLIYGLAIVNTVDNVLRPLIIGRSAKTSEVTVFIGILGGLAAFGILGIIIGPIILEYLRMIILLYKEGGIDYLV